jgi:hypothetical protein
MQNTSGNHLTTEARAALDAGDVDALLALSRARYAGWFMEADGGDGGDTGAEGDQGAAGEDAGGDQGDQNDDKAGEDARIQRANREAAKYRTERNELQTKVGSLEETLQKLAAVLNPDASKDADPAKQLAEVTTTAQSLQAENAGLKAELLVHTIAGKHGGNPVALLDSRGFVTALHGLDPSAGDYAEKVAAAITEAVKNSPSLAAVQGSASGGAELDAQKRENANKQRPTSLGAAIGGRYASN